MRTAERVLVGQSSRTSVPRPAVRLWGEQGVLYPLLYLAPFLIFFTAFEIYPIFEGLYVSLTAWDLLTDPRWVGLANYTALLQDSLFQTSLRNTVLFVVLEAPLAIGPAGLAMLIREHARRTLFRSAFVAPLMISASSVGVLAMVLQPGVRADQLLRHHDRPAGSALAQRGGVGHVCHRHHHDLVDVGLQHGPVPRGFAEHSSAPL